MHRRFSNPAMMPVVWMSSQWWETADLPGQVQLHDRGFDFVSEPASLAEECQAIFRLASCTFGHAVAEWQEKGQKHDILQL